MLPYTITSLAAAGTSLSHWLQASLSVHKSVEVGAPYTKTSPKNRHPRNLVSEVHVDFENVPCVNTGVPNGFGCPHNFHFKFLNLFQIWGEKKLASFFFAIGNK